MKVSLVCASYDLTYSITQLNGAGELSKQHNETKQAFATAQANRIVPTTDNRFAICTNPLIIIADPRGSKAGSYNGHQTNVTDAVFVENQFYTCSEDRTIKIWGKNVCRPQCSISTGASLNAISILPDKNTLVTCNEKGAIEMFDVRNTAERLSAISIASCPVRSMAVAKEGTKIIAAMQNGTVHFISNDNATMKDEKEFIAHKGIPLRLVVSPNEKYFVTTGNDSAVKLWDLNTGDSAGSFEAQDMTKYVWDAAFTPDSAWLCTGGSDKIARVWDVQSKTLLAHFEWHSKGITALNVIKY